MDLLSLVISISREEVSSNSCRLGRLSLLWYDSGLIRILQEIDKFVPPSTPLALIIRRGRWIESILDYLKQPKTGKDEAQTWPLPTLRSLHFILRSNTQYCDCISSFAQARKDISRITIELPGTVGSDSDWYTWDAPSVSFIPLKEKQ